MGRNARMKRERRGKLPIQDQRKRNMKGADRGTANGLVELRSTWDSDQYKAFMEAAKAKRPELKSDIDRLISELRDRIRPLDRMKLLGAAAIALQVSTEDNFGDGGPTRFSHMEYLVSLALAEPVSQEPTEPTEAEIQWVIDTIDAVFQKVTQYYATEIAEKGDQGAITELRFMMQLHTLVVRGDSYVQHTRDLTLRILDSNDRFFETHFGLKGRDVWTIFEKAMHSVQDHIGGQALRSLGPILKSHAAFVAWSKKQDPRKFSTFEDLRHAFHESGLAPTDDETENFVQYMKDFGGTMAFRYIPSDAREEQLIKALSTEFGANGVFTGVHNWEGWPLNPSVVYDFPFIKYRGDFLIPLVPRLLSDTPHIVDRLVARIDPEYYNTSFAEKRGKVLEHFAMDLLKQGLKPQQALSSLYYTPPGQNRSELDGLITVGDAIIIVEAKAGHISEAARRGAPRGLRSDVEDTIGAAFNQGQRVLAYLNSAEEVQFYNEHGDEVLRVKARDYRHRFIVNVTMSPLFVLGTALPRLKDIGALKGQDWPWAVYVSDLQVIVELTKHPVQLLHYIRRRLQANRPGVRNVDELDLYGYYLDSGLYFKPGEFEDPDQYVSFSGYTAKIDAYFYYKEGIKSRAVPMPVQKLLPEIDMLLTKLEELHPAGYVSAGFSLLDWDSMSRGELVKGVRLAEQLHMRDKKEHSITVKCGDLVLCLVVGPRLPDKAIFEAWTRKWAGKGVPRAAMIAWVGRLKKTDQLAFWTEDLDAL